MSKLYIMQGKNRADFIERTRIHFGNDEGESAALRDSTAKTEKDNFYLTIGMLIEHVTHSEWQAIIIDHDCSTVAEIEPFAAIGIAYGYEPVIVRTDDSLDTVDTTGDYPVVHADDVTL